MAYSYFFRRFAPIVMHIYDYQCVICTQNRKHLEVHHIDKNSKNDSVFNLVPVCLSCHSALHTWLNADFTQIQKRYSKELKKLENFRRLHY